MQCKSQLQGTAQLLASCGIPVTSSRATASLFTRDAKMYLTVRWGGPSGIVKEYWQKKKKRKKKALVSWRCYTELRKPILWQGSVSKYNNHNSTRSQRDKAGGRRGGSCGGSLWRRPRPAGLGMDKLNFSQPRGSSLHRAHGREDYGSLGGCGVSYEEHVGTWWEMRVRKWHQGTENLRASPRLIYMRREATEGKQQTKTRTHISGLLFFCLIY